MNDSLLEKAEKSIKTFFDTDPVDCDEKLYGRIYQKANIGFRLYHDDGVNKRLEIDQKLRAITLAISDPIMREEYTRMTLPKLLPDLKAKNN